MTEKPPIRMFEATIPMADPMDAWDILLRPIAKPPMVAKKKMLIKAYMAMIAQFPLPRKALSIKGFSLVRHINAKSAVTAAVITVPVTALYTCLRFSLILFILL